MNIKIKLEKLEENKSWVRLYFHDGSGIAGKVVTVGQDFIEIESYGCDDSPNSRNYAKHLIPLNVIKMFTIESSNFADAERKRLQYLSQIDTSVREKEIENLG